MNSSDGPPLSDLYSLVARIFGRIDTLPGGVAVGVVAPMTTRGLVEYDVDAYLAPWPADRAADMLTAWQAVTV